MGTIFRNNAEAATGLHEMNDASPTIEPIATQWITYLVWRHTRVASLRRLA